MALIYNAASSYVAVLVAILILGFNALLIYVNDNLNCWTIIFWRQLFQFTVLLLYFSFESSHQNNHVVTHIYGKITNVGILGAFAALFDALVWIFVTIAYLNTYTINVSLIFGISPITDAILSYFVLGYTVHLRTYIAATVCMICVGVIYYIDSTTDSGNNDDIGSQGIRWYGNLMAILSLLCDTIQIVLYRLAYSMNPNEEIDMIPILIISSFLQCIISLSCGVEFAAVMPYNYGYLLLSGAVILPLFSCILIWVSKYIPPVELAVLCLFEMIYQPFVVWAFGFSTPPVASLIVGSIIFITLLIHGYFEIYSEENKDNVTHTYTTVSDADDLDDSGSLAVHTPTRRNREI